MPLIQRRIETPNLPTLQAGDDELTWAEQKAAAEQARKDFEGMLPAVLTRPDLFTENGALKQADSMWLQLNKSGENKQAAKAARDFLFDAYRAKVAIKRGDSALGMAWIKSLKEDRASLAATSTRFGPAQLKMMDAAIASLNKELKSIELAQVQVKIDGFEPSPSTQTRRPAIYDEAEALMPKLDRLQKYYDSKNGVLSSGRIIQDGVENALRARKVLKEALTLPEADPTRTRKVEDAVKQVKQRLAEGFPKNSEPAQYVDDFRENWLFGFKNSERIADALGAIPGPAGKILSFGMKEIIVGLRVASNDMSPQEALAKTIVNGIDAAVGSKLPGGSGPVGVALRSGISKALQSAIPDAAAVANNPKLSWDQHVQAMGRVAAGAVVEGFKEAVASLVGHYLKVGIDSETKQQVIDMVWNAAQKLGIDQLCKDSIDKLKSIPPRN
jgi:hypothetical protein